MENVKKIIFFGCNGYIGSHLVVELKKLGYIVLGFDISDAPKVKSLDSYTQINISNMNEVSKINFDVDFVYYFSGLTGTLASIDNALKFVDVNEKGLLNILSCIKEQNILPKIVFPSTRLVYKGLKNKSLSEDSEKEFKTIYALNKFQNEQCLKIFNSSYNIPYTIFRICVPYGNNFDNDYSYGTIGFFLSQAKSKKPITLYGNGDLKRTFTSVTDICNQIIKVSEKAISNRETYNIGGEVFSLLEIAQLIADKFNVEVKHIEWPEVALKLESGDTIFDSSKIEKLVSLNKISLTDWINNIENINYAS